MGREDAELDPPVGHWAVRRRWDDVLLGSITLRRMPPLQEDLELAWQFAPDHWGNGYATEAAQVVAAWAFEESADELFAVMRPAQRARGEAAWRLGMEWVGETNKYYDLRLQVYRPGLRSSSSGTTDIDLSHANGCPGELRGQVSWPRKDSRPYYPTGSARGPRSPRRSQSRSAAGRRGSAQLHAIWPTGGTAPLRCCACSDRPWPVGEVDYGVGMRLKVKPPGGGSPSAQPFIARVVRFGPSSR